MTSRRNPRAALPITCLSLLAGLAVSGFFTPTLVRADVPPEGEGERRLFSQFFTDPASTNQWWEVQFHAYKGAVGPAQEADGWAIGPVIAIAPTDRLEFGGRVFFTDYSLDNDLGGPGTSSFDGASGAGDVELFGKYRLTNDPFQFAVGATVSIPTGSESDGLGTGKLVPAIFAAARHDYGRLIGVAHAGLRFNQDADIFGDHLVDEFNGKVSLFLGAGVIGHVGDMDKLDWTLEATAETARFESNDRFDNDPDIRATGGINWTPVRHHTVRGAVSAGLGSAAPDFELTLAYAYHF